MNTARRVPAWLARTWRSGLLPTPIWASPQPPVPRAGLRPPLRDLATAVAGTVIVVLGTYGEAHPTHPDHYFTGGYHLPQTPTAALLLVLAAGLALVWRHSFPLRVLGVATAAVVAFSLLGYVNGAALLLPAAAIWAVARARPIRQSVAWAVALTVVLMAATAANNPLGPTGGGLILIPAEVAVALFGGIAVANRRAYIDSLRDRAERDARRQVDEERLRIARELHDVVAHTMATINVQASAAAQLLTDRPEQAAESLAAIRAASKDGLRELRAILNVLRHADDAADPTQPAPGLARLDALAAGVRQAGLPVTVTVAGPPRPLPAVTDLAAFRIIQEALTNSIRHAGPATAAVAVSYGDDCLLVEVTDDGGGATVRSAKNGEVARADGQPLANGGGHGLRGIRERAAAAGGTVEIGPAQAGGFRVAARFPRRAPMIRVVLADDQKLIRAGFRVLIEVATDITVVGEAVNGEQAVELARGECADVVLMDIRMPGVDGLEATRRIAADDDLAGVKVIILTTFESDEYVYQAIRVGASGFLVKDTDPDDLIHAIRVVARGDALLSPSVTRRLITTLAAQYAAAPLAGPYPPGQASTAHARQLSRLTEREREVLVLVAEGLSNTELAHRLFLSPLTTKTHVSRIMTKLEARDRAQLVVIAYESGLVTPGSATFPA